MAKLHIFKGGRRQSGNGITRNYSADDLKRCAENYSTSAFKAPLVLGHPTDGAPAYGWVENLTADGENLLSTANAQLFSKPPCIYRKKCENPRPFFS